MDPDLVATRYTSIPDRGKYASLVSVRRELNKVISTGPTTLHPLERAGYLQAVLGDLAPEGGVWQTWPEDVHLLALTTVKVLGRNPVGSKEVMLQPDSLATVIFHTALPRVLAQMPSSPRPPTMSSTSSNSENRSGRPPTPTSRPALEAMRALANTLVLHPIARVRVARMGVGEAVARALAEPVAVDRLFLLCRIGFLVTAERDSASVVRAMVDDEGIVPRLVFHLHSNRPIQANHDALGELLKLTGNVLRTYPTRGWDPKLSPLLYPILACMYGLDIRDLLPPVTHALHALLDVPFAPDLLGTWYTAPQGERDRDREREPSKSLSPPPTQKKGMFRRSPEPGRRGSDSGMSMDRSSSSSGSDDGKAAGLSARCTDPSAFPRRLVQILTGFVDTHLKGTEEIDHEFPLDDILPPVLLLAAQAANGSQEMRSYFRGALLPSTLDRSRAAGPLETRPGLLGVLLRVMNGTHHPHSRDTAGEFLWAVCDGDQSELVEEIGYGNAAGLLFRKGITGPPQARIQELPDSTPEHARQRSGTRDSGSRNQHPFAAPQPRRPSRAPPLPPQSPPPPTSSHSASPPHSASPRTPHTPHGPHYTHMGQHGHAQGHGPGFQGQGQHGLQSHHAHQHSYSHQSHAPPSHSSPLPPPRSPQRPPAQPPRHAITGLERTADDDDISPLAGMSEAEKEREAERMFVLFERLERNPVLRAGAPQADGSQKGLQDLMRDRVKLGDADRWEREEAERERQLRAVQEEEDEREARREMAEYRRRMGR